MNCERYKNKMTELYTKMGTIKINRDRMVIGSVSSCLLSQYIDKYMNSNNIILITTASVTSIILAIKAIINTCEIYKLDRKCELVQEIYYNNNKQKKYTINNKQSIEN